MKLTDMELDLGAVDGGVWVSDIPDLEGVSFQVRGTEYGPYQAALRAEMLKTGRKQRLASTMDGARFEELTRKLIAKHLLMDWEGIEAADGTDFPYSPEAALTFMTDRKYRPIQRGVSYAIDLVDTGLASHREEAAGN